MLTSKPAVLLLFLVAFNGCGFYEAFMRIRQIRTFATLQEICFKIDRARNQSGGYVGAAEATSLIRSVNGGRDAWGNRFIFLSNNDHRTFSYVVISPGSDGRLDKKSGEYFSMRPMSVKGFWTKDIVFRDGEAVTLAGK